MGFFDVDPIRALVWSAIVNGVISVPIMVVLMLVGQSQILMGRYTITGRHRVLGWAATGLMALAVATMAVSGF
jgi:Mn2+/Fe2+ NRAMP family transporter